MFSGFLQIETNDVYLFCLTSDDGSRLIIDGEVVVDNDGLHGSQELLGTIPLAKGWHPVTVEWFNKTGGAVLHLQMGVMGGTVEDIPSSSFAQ